MKIAIIGTGYVGLVTGASLALLGHNIICVGRDRNKIDQINKGISPFYEPGLDGLIKKNIDNGRLKSTDNLEASIKDSEVIIIAVGTPTVKNKIDLSAIQKVSKQIGEELRKSKRYQVIVVKSTVIPTTTDKVIKPLLEKYSGKLAGSFGLCMSPEFLREGNAVEDATNPDRIVIGQYDEKSGKKFAEIYTNVVCPKVFTNLRTAEMTKYAANALFATLISYSNEIARICETVGNIDVVDVWKGVHLDSRLSPKVLHEGQTLGVLHYIFSGCGYGGSCFPKDTKALLAYSKAIGVDAPIIESVINVNNTQPQRMIVLLKQTIGDLKNKKIAVLGLSFKPETDDLRESASISVIKVLLEEGAGVYCHDPLIVSLDSKREFDGLKINLCKKIDQALKNADGVLVMTAWDKYKKISPEFFKKTMKNPVVIDGRRIYEKNKFISAGITYQGIGLSRL